ncbi:MAG: hypothetical protein AB8E15_12870 [Bdellovibrionales bacterium]
MSEEQQNKGPAQPEQQAKKKKKEQPASNVIPFSLNQCVEEDCKQKPDRAGFCNEHYAWFKFGAITKEGQHAKDFDKKMQAFNKLAAKKAA